MDEDMVFFKNKTPIVGAHWANEYAFLSRGCIVTSNGMNKNRPVSLIFNWYISKMQPLCPQNIA